MAQRSYNYLRTHRRRAGLSQAEMAFLLCSRSGAKVSRYEHGARRPSLETLFVYEVVFRVPVREFFPEVFREIERKTTRRAALLARKLHSERPNKHTLRKLDILKALSSRTGTATHDAL